MSHNYYDDLWLTAREDLESILRLDRRVQERTPIRDKAIALSSALLVYLKYRNLVKRLVLCNDQIVQVQKRELVKSVLDASIARMLEYKRAIVKLVHTEYQWPDHILNQLKFTPDDVRIFSPRANQEVFLERRRYIEELLLKAEETTTLASRLPSAKDIDEAASSRSRIPRRKRMLSETEEALTTLETAEQRAEREAKEEEERAYQKAITLIQSHERARVARCYGTSAKRLYDYNRRLALGEITQKKIDRATYNRAATVIQKAWKAYLRKKEFRKRIEKVEELLGMTMLPRDRDIFDRDEATYKRRLQLMPDYVARYERAVEEERTRLWRDVKAGLTEDTTDEVRQWFADWYNKGQTFDDYPPASKGGSALITLCETAEPGDRQAAQAAKKKEDQKKEKSEDKKGKKEKGEDEGTFNWKMTATKAFGLLEAANREFADKWSFRDSGDNPTQREYLDLITSKLCHELQLEVREIADELLRVELDRLNRALMKDHGEKPKKGKKKKPKKAGAGKKKGKRKKRNALDNVPIEDQLNELVQANIVRNYPLTSLDDWIGDLSYQNYEAQLEFREYTHRLGEIKQLITEYCILPLSSKEVHQVAPLVRSISICGLPNTGKTFLANAICSEIGATMFDVSPQVLSGQFKGRRGQKKLLGMIGRVARAYAPSVIYIDGGEKPWLKKVPPEDRVFQPKRYARYYPKIVKAIKPGDQILFLTTASEPYKAKKPFIKIHDKFIMIPLTDYNTLYMYYKDLLAQYHGVDRDIDVSCLAKVSVGVPLDFVRRAVENVLNIERRIRLKFEPLRPQEIFEQILTYETPTKAIAELQKFENKTPLGKRRLKVLAAENAQKKALADAKAKQDKRNKRN